MNQKKVDSQNQYIIRKCYVCGEEHEESTICPQILKTLGIVEKKKITSFFWGNVFVQCYKKKKSFLQLICELCELTEVFLGDPYHKEFFNKGGRAFPHEGFSHNIELTLEYCSAFIGCKISDFFMNDELLFNELFFILSNTTCKEEVLSEVDYDDESYTLSMECVAYNFFDNLPEYMKFPCYNDAHHLILVFDKIIEGEHESYKLYFYLPRVIGNYFHVFVDSEWASHWYIPLYYDFQGKFQKLYEKFSVFDYDELMQKLPCSDSKFVYWKKQIVTACHNNSVIWVRTDGKSRYTHAYTTTYKDANIRFSVNQTKEIYCLTVFKNGFTYKFFVDQYEDEASIKSMTNLFVDIYRNWQETSSNLEFKVISYRDVLISSNSLSCRSHSLIAYRGVVPILTADYKEETYELYVSYCKNCGVYRALTSDYEELLKHGKPLCKVYDSVKAFENATESTFMYKSQSILYIMGYTVRSDSKLTEEERRKILSTAIQNNLISSHDAIGFLNWLVETRKSRQGYEIAVKKWISDILFLKELTKDDREKIEVDALYV